MSITVAMMYDFIHSLKATAAFLQNNKQYHKEVRPCSPYKTFSTLNITGATWAIVSSLSLGFRLRWSTSEELTDLTCMHYSCDKRFWCSFSLEVKDNC